MSPWRVDYRIVDSSTVDVYGVHQDGQEYKAYSFYFRFDGCGQILRFFNGSADANYEDVDNLHFCDLAELFEIAKTAQRKIIDSGREIETGVFK